MRPRRAPGMIALALGAAVLAAACLPGGGDGGPTPVVTIDASGTPVLVGTPTPADIAYAGGLCRAVNTYVAAISAETAKDPNLFGDQDKLLRTAAPILDRFAKDLDRAKAPKDLSAFHGALVKRVKEMARRAKEGEAPAPEDLSRFSKDVPVPAEQVQARLAAAAGQLPECAAFGIANLFGEVE
ncbi:MAG: hypothetical protein AMXMBFR80_02950 [Dehalococcoidia bacterium]|nr:hypothetical protein [Tepidiformaceae bacterium]